MSSGVLLDLPTEQDLDLFTRWLARKWRPLWYWYASFDEAVNIARIAISKAHVSWKEGGGANRVTWATNAARIEYLTRQHHEQKWKRVNKQPKYSMDLVVDETMPTERNMDLVDIMGYLKRNMKPKYFGVLASRVELTLQEVANMYGISRERVRQIEVKANEQARKLITGMLHRNKCTHICELY